MQLSDSDGPALGSAPSTRGAPAVQRACGGSCGCAACADGASAGAAPLHESPRDVQRRLGAGHAIDSATSAKFSDAYGTSLDHVRLHPASPVAVEHRADALTVGHHVAFAPGRYRPGTAAGDELIGHELAHVAQQSGGTPGVQTAPGPASDAHESEADAASAAVQAGEPAPPLSAVVAPRAEVQRNDTDEEGDEYATETETEFGQRVKAQAVALLNDNIEKLAEWTSFVESLTLFQLNAQVLSQAVQEYALTAQERGIGYRFEDYVTTREGAWREYTETVHLSTQTSYRQKVGSLRNVVLSRYFGSTESHNVADRLDVATGVMSPDQLPPLGTIEGHPAYQGMAEAFLDLESGDQGACQTCHDVNYFWQQNVEEYGTGLPDPRDPYGMNHLFDAFDIADSTGLLRVEPVDNVVQAPTQPSAADLAAISRWVNGDFASDAPAVQERRAAGAPAVQYDPPGAGTGEGNRFAPAAPVPTAVARPTPRTNLCGDLPAEGTTAAPSPPESWGPGSERVMRAIRSMGTVLAPLGPRGYRVIRWQTFDSLWNATPDDVQNLRAQILADIEARRDDYRSLIAKIEGGEVNYFELCPIVDALLPSTNDRVQMLAVRRIHDQRMRGWILAGLGIALLLLTPVLGPAAFAAGLLLDVAGAVVAADELRLGEQIGEGTGSGVYSLRQEAEGEGLVTSGKIGLVTSAIGIFAAAIGPLTRLGRGAGAAAEAGGAARVSEVGESVMMTHPALPNTVARVDDEGLAIVRTTDAGTDEVAFWSREALEAAPPGTVPAPTRGALPEDVASAASVAGGADAAAPRLIADLGETSGPTVLVSAEELAAVQASRAAPGSTPHIEIVAPPPAPTRRIITLDAPPELGQVASRHLPPLPAGSQWTRQGDLWVPSSLAGQEPSGLRVVLYGPDEDYVHVLLYQGDQLFSTNVSALPRDFTNPARATRSQMPTMAELGYRRPHLPWNPDRGHVVDLLDTLRNPGRAESNADVWNFIPENHAWNRWVRNPWVQRMRPATRADPWAGYGQMMRYSDTPVMTGGTAVSHPMPTSGIYYEIDAAGNIGRAWEVPMQWNYGAARATYGRGLRTMQDLPSASVSIDIDPRFRGLDPGGR